MPCPLRKGARRRALTTSCSKLWDARGRSSSLRSSHSQITAASARASWVARATTVVRTVSRSSVDVTTGPLSLSARSSVSGDLLAEAVMGGLHEQEMSNAPDSSLRCPRLGLWEVHLLRNSGPRSRRSAPATGAHADLSKSLPRRTRDRPPRPRLFSKPREEGQFDGLDAARFVVREGTLPLDRD